MRPPLFKRFLKDNRGTLLAETAFMLTLIIGLTLSGLEIARYALLHQKMERIAASVSDLIAQAHTITEADVTNIFDAVEHVASPFTMGPNGLVIISSISSDAGTGTVMNWQRIGAGTLADTSQIGTPGGELELPNGISVADGHTIIAAEVIFQYAPWLVPDIVGSPRLYHTAVFRPRFGTLTSIDP